jgi:hypothetical protein
VLGDEAPLRQLAAVDLGAPLLPRPEGEGLGGTAGRRRRDAGRRMASVLAIRVHHAAVPRLHERARHGQRRMFEGARAVHGQRSLWRQGSAQLLHADRDGAGRSGRTRPADVLRDSRDGRHVARAGWLSHPDRQRGRAAHRPRARGLVLAEVLAATGKGPRPCGPREPRRPADSPTASLRNTASGSALSASPPSPRARRHAAPPARAAARARPPAS